MDWCYVPETLQKTSLVFSVLNSGGAILLEPPKKITKTFYTCDKHFHLDPILEMFKNEISFGLIFITGKMYSFYKIMKSGDHMESKKLVSDDVDLPNKHRKGGQSSVRFARLHDEREDAYIKKLGELTVKTFMSNNNTNHLIEKLIIAGPGDKKKLLAQDDLVIKYFRDNIIIKNTSDVTDQIIFETINQSRSLFESKESNDEDDIIDYINDLMINDIDKLVFGIKEINECVINNDLCKIVTDNETIELINKNDNSNCEIIIIPIEKLKKMGLDVIGVRWY